ncbi:hypothetical protein [Candidatus Nanohalobium constans]|nr:hypothetical protein [Candidatus Nanohalobium constans]
MDKVERPLEKMRKLRSEISFSAKEVENMMKESKKVWNEKGV